MSYHHLDRKLEQTIKQYIGSIGEPPCDLWLYGEAVSKNVEIEEPYVAIRCRGSTPMFPEIQLGSNTGNRMYNVEIAIRSHAADVYENGDVSVVAIDAHDQIVGVILDMFYRSDIQDVLHAAATTIGNIGVCQVDAPDMDTDMKDRSWVTIIKIVIGCYPIAE